MVADDDAGPGEEVLGAGDDLELDACCEAHGVAVGDGDEVLGEAVVAEAGGGDEAEEEGGEDAVEGAGHEGSKGGEGAGEEGGVGAEEGKGGEKVEEQNEGDVGEGGVDEEDAEEGHLLFLVERAFVNSLFFLYLWFSGLVEWLRLVLSTWNKDRESGRGEEGEEGWSRP